MVAVGELSTRVKFEKNTPVKITGGPGEVDEFTEFLQCWGKLRKNSGQRGLDVGEIVENNSYNLDVYFQQALLNEIIAGIKFVRVVTEDGRKFTISSWETVDEKRKMIRILLNEKR